MKRIELAGTKVRAGTVLSYAGELKWKCSCGRCGGVFLIHGKAIREARNIPCGGCGVTHNTTHGNAKRENQSGAYKSWVSMLSRTRQNPKDRYYHLYTGRGIKVCERWLDFANFLSDMGDRPEGMQLDRIDTNGNYEPCNCRWVSSRQNNQNRRNNRFVTFHGERIVYAEAARRLGMTRQGLRARVIRSGSDVISD